MTGCVRVKDGVAFTVISPAGFRILAALDAVARQLLYDLTITSACDGAHSGPDDPHHLGSAYDIRTKPLSPSAKDDLIVMLLSELADNSEQLQPVGTGFAIGRFYAQLEDRNGPNEHLHVQLRNGRTYPPVSPELRIA